MSLTLPIRAVFHGLTFALLLLITTANAGSVIREATLYQNEETLFINVTTNIDFPKAVREAINSGIQLTFEYQFEIKNKKWYKPTALAELKKTYYLSYHRMTDKYMLSNPVTFENQEFDSLALARQAMQQLYDFPLILVTQIPEEAAVLAIRFRLTNDNLPSYLRVERIVSKSWDIDSKWRQWDFP